MHYFWPSTKLEESQVISRNVKEDPAWKAFCAWFYANVFEDDAYLKQAKQLTLEAISCSERIMAKQRRANRKSPGEGIP